LLSKEKFAWQLLWAGDSTVFSKDGLREVAMTNAGPIITQHNCVDQLQALCNSSGHVQTHMHAMYYSFGGGFAQDLANFLLIRGPFAWLGTGWTGCGGAPKRPATLDTLDVGLPLTNCTETATGSGIFVRKYTKVTVQMNCSSWIGSVTVLRTA
jgi:hypothetical protein